MAETVYSPTAAAFGRGGFALNPYAWLFTGEEQLRIGVTNSVAGVVVTVQGRFLPLKGERPQAFQFTVTPTSDRMLTAGDFPIGEGYLLNLSAIVASGAPLIGQTYIMVQILRGFGAKVVLGCLLGGYITAAQHLAYPGSPILSSIEGGGVTRTLTGTDPAAGGEILETTPTGARWQLLSFEASLVTDATVANRQTMLFYDNGTLDYARSPQVAIQTAGLTRRYGWTQGLALETVLWNLVPTAGLPLDMPILAGHRLATFTNNLQAGDNWGAPTFTVREWLEVA